VTQNGRSPSAPGEENALESGVVGSVVHAALLGELIEWWEDLLDTRIGSQAVILPVPQRWGRSTILHALHDHVQADQERICLTIRLDGATMPSERGAQARELVDGLRDQAELKLGALEFLGVTRPAGITVQAIGVGSLFTSMAITAVGLERVCQLIRRWITVVARMTPPRKVRACLSYRVAMPRHCLRRRYPRSTVLRLA
jgi:hypothetical protein